VALPSSVQVSHNDTATPTTGTGLGFIIQGAQVPDVIVVKQDGSQGLRCSYPLGKHNGPFAGYAIATQINVHKALQQQQVSVVWYHALNLSSCPLTRLCQSNTSKGTVQECPKCPCHYI